MNARHYTATIIERVVPRSDRSRGSGWVLTALELANTQYHGWALCRTATRCCLRARAARDRRERSRLREARRTFRGCSKSSSSCPTTTPNRPKALHGGLGDGRICVVDPETGGYCPATPPPSIRGISNSGIGRPLDSLAECWRDAPGMNTFRGDAWLPEPCRSCPESGRDFGGCRCQAFALTGDPSVTDPACELSPHHQIVVDARDEPEAPLRYRGS